MQHELDEPIDHTGSVVLSQPAGNASVVPIQPAAVADVPGPACACPKLSQALSIARDACKMAVKDKTNTFHKYQYASADEVITVAKDALTGTGLAIIPQAQELTVIAAGNLSMYALNRTIFLSHSSGEYVPLSVKGWPVVPEKGRPLDKAFAVALTTSLSYLLRDLLQMPRGEDSDMNHRDDRKAEATPPPRQAPTPAPTGPTPFQGAAKDLEESESLDQLAAIWKNINGSRRLTDQEKKQLAALKDQRKAAMATVTDLPTEEDMRAWDAAAEASQREKLEATR